MRGRFLTSVNDEEVAKVSPVYAGEVPISAQVRDSHTCFPRVCEGGSLRALPRTAATRFPPCMRGRFRPFTRDIFHGKVLSLYAGEVPNLSSQSVYVTCSSSVRRGFYSLLIPVWICGILPLCVGEVRRCSKLLTFPARNSNSSRK